MSSGLEFRTELHHLISQYLHVCAVGHLYGGNTSSDCTNAVSGSALEGFFCSVVNVPCGDRDPVYFIRFRKICLEVSPRLVCHIKTSLLKDNDGEASCHMDLDQGLVNYLLDCVGW